MFAVVRDDTTCQTRTCTRKRQGEPPTTNVSDLHVHKYLTSSSSCARKTAGSVTDALVVGSRARAPHRKEDAYLIKGKGHGLSVGNPDSDMGKRVTSCTALCSTQVHVCLDCYLFVQNVHQRLIHSPVHRMWILLGGSLGHFHGP